ncbi:hypothetical protein PPERSA_04595 [Pseudocohnilembus persalinus]|uniref:Insulin-like growth factor binding protein, N-terminal n=1 Tax=Pseudocohnilembus persalinus TaxID=266149 RepID=A0A0V0QAN5_PSEPJ|nr:hypothetical protein PPERSA_04595 [Pseudocohnilembus persalinus]|eukprot:KRW99233.1 hypothetical protein PPERSA_04595 [Pseudocohnilembus persalinus]
MFKHILILSLALATVYSTRCTSDADCTDFRCDTTNQLCFTSCTDGNDQTHCKSNYCSQSSCIECDNNNFHCENNFQCYNTNTCAQQCDVYDNSGCRDGYICFGYDMCVKCYDDAHCTDNFQCNTSAQSNDPDYRTCATSCSAVDNSGCAGDYLCDGNNNCVECLSDKNCSSELVCSSGTCVSADADTDGENTEDEEAFGFNNKFSLIFALAVIAQLL